MNTAEAVEKACAISQQRTFRNHIEADLPNKGKIHEEMANPDFNLQALLCAVRIVPGEQVVILGGAVPESAVLSKTDKYPAWFR